MANLKQHISLVKLNIERPRQKRSGRGRLPDRDNRVHGNRLQAGIRHITEDFQKVKQFTPLGIEPVLVFSLKKEASVDEIDLQRSGLTYLDEDTDKRIFVLTDDGAPELARRIGDYSQDVPQDRKNPHYNWLAALSGEMESTPLDLRIGPKLKMESIDPDKEYRLDVELWSVPDVATNRKRLGEVREYIEAQGGQVLDEYVGELLTIARVKISGDFLLTLSELTIIRVIDLPPKPSTGIFQQLRTSLGEFNHPIPYPPSGAPGICVIDSGVMAGHPLLGNAIGETRAFPSTSGDGIDSHGHGTMVAGVALYGDVKQCAESLTFEPPFLLYSARVLNHNNHFDDDQLIVNQMQEAIRYYRREYNCRIFNISIGDPELVYEGGKPSAWAYILDTLARELDLVIVVSAGNFPIISNDAETSAQIYLTYPQYLLNGNKDSRIIEPATAANVITVGSLAHSDKAYHLERYPGDLDARPIAPVDKVSPFTRCGPGINKAIKPDVCEYGGNALFRERVGIIGTDIGLGIVSLNRDFTRSLFTTEIGSSLAAPKVTHLAAHILQHYPHASASLVRALIANSASVPEIAFDDFNSDNDRLNLYGHGKPNAERAIFSDDNRATLVADDVIALDTIQLYEIPIPEEFQKLKGTRFITVTMAYDSPVKNTRADYLGTKMSFRLFRGLETQHIIDWYGAHAGDVNPDKIPKKYQCEMDIGPNQRETSTLQKGVFRAATNRMFTDYATHGGNFHLLVRCESVWASSDEYGKQRYGLVVTIEHEDEFIQLYNLVDQRIQTRERVRVRG